MTESEGGQHAQTIQLCFKESRLEELAAIYSDDYMLVRPDGSALSKDEVLTDLRIGGLAFKAIEIADVDVRIHGDTAILTAASRTVTSETRQGSQIPHPACRYLRD